MGRSKVTTAEQYEKLCDMMATKRDIAQGFQKPPKEEVQEFWEEVARNLNALGPPTKDSNTWRKVWIDWKCYMKRKLSHNKKERMSTGGGPCHLQRLSPLEESGARDYGDSVEVEELAETTEMDISARSDDIPSTSRANSQNREVRADKESTSSLLKQQIQNQKEFYAETKKFNEAAFGKVEEVTTYLRHMNRSLETLAETAVKQLEEQKRHNRIKEELVQEKVEIKMQMLRLDPSMHCSPPQVISLPLLIPC
ncbi:uncharacterized protein LOC125777719 [Bactrocera dorsalis]|uniref:Regulatory protein zeste n=1 Tax=Bactrocera dorsalis TaxID=27457 RepID=A0ABM3JID9_BACDO|nr:uncharacterized protein LOC125777719 [Bactrocera dorsalis]